MNRYSTICLLWLATLLASCTTVHVQQSPAALDRGARWALLPIVNHTQTPQAGLRAEAILETLVRARGVPDLTKYPSALNSESLFEPAERAAVEKAMNWADENGAIYALTGTVDEWRYKVGVDGEPAVGITLQLIDMGSKRVLWSAAGSKTGWSREALSAVAQKLLVRLTQPLSVGGNDPSTASTNTPSPTATPQTGNSSSEPRPSASQTIPSAESGSGLTEPADSQTTQPETTTEPAPEQLELPPNDKPALIKPTASTQPAPGEMTSDKDKGFDNGPG